MARRAFYSFHFDNDNWRVQTVRNIRAIEPQPKLPGNEWETVWKKGNKAIQDWIDGQMAGKSCVIVLIGSNTAGRPWVRYEVVKGWNDNKGVLGIHIHNLQDSNNMQSAKGANPFDQINFDNGRPMSDQLLTYDPPYSESLQVYRYIADNIEGWADAAVRARGRT